MLKKKAQMEYLWEKWERKKAKAKE